MDLANRPELCYGTIDITVPPEYWSTPPAPRLLPSLYGNSVGPGAVIGARKPEPLRTLFLIDVSASSVSSGVLNDICGAIFESVQSDAGDNHQDSKLIGIMTFNTSLHFYNLSVSRALFAFKLRMDSCGRSPASRSRR